MTVTEVRFVAGTPQQVREGLLGFVRCTYGILRLEGITVRRSVEGRAVLSFPMRRDASGRPHFYFRPASDRARREIEYEVLKALGIEDACLGETENE